MVSSELGMGRTVSLASLLAVCISEMYVDERLGYRQVIFGDKKKLAMRLKDEIINCVAFLCERKTPVATAFFISVPSPNTEHIYLITAKHCVEDSNPNELHLRISSNEYPKWLFRAY